MELFKQINSSTNIQIFLVFVIIFIGGIFLYIEKDICETVITYQVGKIDDKFNLSSEDAKSAVVRAENIWEEETVLNLFEYQIGGTLVINFITNDDQVELQKKQEFDKGDYLDNVINVYQFEGPGDLRLLLAHEFGHALGVEHVEDQLAVMNYSLANQNRRNISLKDEDILGLKKVCSIL